MHIPTSMSATSGYIVHIGKWGEKLNPERNDFFEKIKSG